LIGRAPRLARALAPIDRHMTVPANPTRMGGLPRLVQRPSRKTSRGGRRAQVRADDPTKPAESNPVGFSFAFAGRGEFWTARFKLMLLGATDATDRASLAAHRCSKRL